MKVRFYIGILFISLQVASVIYSRFVPERFFCWAPYDSHTLFETLVTIDGRTLSQEEAEARYGYKMKGWEQRSIANIFSLIRQYETTYGKGEQADVKVLYSTNGEPQKEWILQR